MRMGQQQLRSRSHSVASTMGLAFLLLSVFGIYIGFGQSQQVRGAFHRGSRSLIEERNAKGDQYLLGIGKADITG
jgi:hypothetical protein